MKYIEELKPGDVFTYKKEYYLLTSDKTSKCRICYSIKDGFVRHLEESTIIDIVKLLTLDEENNIIPIKADEK